MCYEFVIPLKYFHLLWSRIFMQKSIIWLKYCPRGFWRFTIIVSSIADWGPAGLVDCRLGGERVVPLMGKWNVRRRPTFFWEQSDISNSLFIVTPLRALIANIRSIMPCFTDACLNRAIFHRILRRTIEHITYTHTHTNTQPIENNPEKPGDDRIREREKEITIYDSRVKIRLFDRTIGSIALSNRHNPSNCFVNILQKQ